jgi:hypothetical protein
VAGLSGCLRIADLLEDVLILVLLTRPASIGDLFINVLAFLRGSKIIASTVALVQLFVLGLAGPTAFKAT